MEMDRFPGKIWVVSHKPVAVAAGLGVMGIHRNVIHPKFGNFILLGTILIGRRGHRATASRSTTTRAWSASCAWRRARSGPSRPDGHFNFSACYTHNYREFMGGFTDWVEQIADSKDALDYRDAGQRLGVGLDVAEPLLRAELQGGLLPGVCPAGEDVIGPFLADRKGIFKEVVARCRRRRRRSTWCRARTPRRTPRSGSRTSR